MISAEERHADEAQLRLDDETRTTFASVLQVLTPDERRDLLRISPVKAWASVLTNWVLVFAAMAVVAWAWPQPVLTVLSALFALCVIGGRQLGMAVLMHEASHHSLFKNRRLNDWVGNWLAAYPVWTKLEPYRRTHLKHHTKTWTDQDPDIGLVLPFPITRDSFKRKVLRDLTGRTGWKFAKYNLMRDLGRGPFRTGAFSDGDRSRLRGLAITNGVLLGLLTLAGYPALYLLWAAAWFTTHTLVIRLRSIAEHSMSPDIRHPLKNTRTTLARWWERLFLAPNYVNYHLEHHLMMTVPHYNLPRMHRLLGERGVLEDAEVVHGYPAILRRATSAPPSTPELATA